MEKKKKPLRRADLILIGALALAALVLGLWQHAARESGAHVSVFVDGDKKASYSLSEDIKIRIVGKDGSYNVLTIENGVASVTDADCPDKLCVHMRPISYDGESIICLPHRLEIRVEGAGSSGVDVK